MMSLSAPPLRGGRNCQTQSKRNMELPQLPQWKPSTATAEQVGGVNLRQVTVLSKADWEGIQYRLNKRQIEAERSRQIQEEKRRLHELSLERVKNWSNTVYGQRQKKLEDRRLRLEKEEEERKKIDIEEAMIQAEKRKAAIEKAKVQQYYQTDRVKAFHSALLLTEVMKEREAQIELKKMREEGRANQDKGYAEKQRRELEEQLRAEEEEKLKVRLDSMKTAEFQKAQIRDRERIAERLKQDDIIEGEELQRLAIEHAEEERQKRLWRHEMSVQQAADNKRQIEDTTLMRQIDRIQEEEEDEECRLFATAKKKMMRLRAEKERQLRDDKQAQLERIRDRLRQQMEQKISDEDTRTQAAVEEKDAQKAAEEAEKAAKREQMLRSIKEHRQSQMRRNEEEMAHEKREAVEALKALREAANVFAANETEKLRVRREEAKELASVHLQQTAERRECERIGREQDLEQSQKNTVLDDVNEAQFQTYARDVIEHCEKRGRNTYPLKKVVSQVVPGRAAQRPNYVVSDETMCELPSFQTSATDATKQTLNGGGSSSKKLGFVW